MILVIVIASLGICAVRFGTYVFEPREARLMTFGTEHELSRFTNLWLVVLPSDLRVRQHRTLRQLLACLPATDRWFPGLSLLRHKKGRNLTFFRAGDRFWRHCPRRRPRHSLMGRRKRAGFRGGLYLGRPLAPAVK